MSEYQFYEFTAIDHPLGTQEMDTLRSISSRATITRTSFRNEYHWGDLHANPISLLRDYFDLHVYVANWGTRHLAVRLPAEAICINTIQEYCVEDATTIVQTGDVAVLSLWSEPENCREWEDGEGWAASLCPLRSGILRGDMSGLYLAWLTILEGR